MKEIEKIIETNFERDFFFDKGSPRTVKNIQNQIDLFNNKYPNYVEEISNNLEKSFPNTKIEAWTHFFRQDRSVRFLVEINEQERYVLQASIFGFFTVYRRSCVFSNDKYSYGNAEFINKGESTVADQLYLCLPNFEKFPWVDKIKLTEIVPSLSVLNEDERFSFKISVADAVFSDHYL